jgi:hypothetical protein
MTADNLYRQLNPVERVPISLGERLIAGAVGFAAASILFAGAYLIKNACVDYARAKKQYERRMDDAKLLDNLGMTNQARRIRNQAESALLKHTFK